MSTLSKKRDPVSSRTGSLPFYAYLKAMQEIAITVDAVVFSKSHDSHQVLLIQRKNQPFQGQWALPGGFVENNEDLEQAAIRELKEETGIELNSMKQVYAFGSPNRDPRQRVVTIAYYSVLSEKPKSKAASDAKDARWFNIDELPELAFDHQEILRQAKAAFGKAPCN